jgi:CBS-domain-containing membrane protein
MLIVYATPHVVLVRRVGRHHPRFLVPQEIMAKMDDRTRTMRVKDLVVRDVITVQPDDSLSLAVSLLAENRISAMPVVDGRDRCKGIISTTDLVRELNAIVTGLRDSGDAGDEGSGRTRAELERRTVGEVMTPDVMTVDLENLAIEAAREMVRSRVHRLAVVDSNNRVMGIVSTLDMLEALSAD